MTLQLDVITPAKIIYSGEVNELLVQTEQGQIGILPNHIGLFTKVVAGELVIKKDKKDDVLAVAGGFLDVHNNKVTLLTDYAIRAEEIEVARAEEAKKKAEKMLSEQKDKKDLAFAEAQLRRSLLELHIAGKMKRRKI